MERNEEGLVVSSVAGIGSEKPTGKLMRIWFPELGGLPVNPALDSGVPRRTLRLKRGEGRGLGSWTDRRDRRAGRGTRDERCLSSLCLVCS